ncbi:MAG: lipase family protein [Ferruginibacter sp.]
MPVNSSPTIRGRMLCASVLTYSIPFTYPINPPNNNIQQTSPYYTGAGYLTPPTMITSNAHYSEAACTVGITQDGIVVAFRGTVYNSPIDWMNDLLVEPVATPGIPGKVHDGFNKAVLAIFNYMWQTVVKLQNTYPGAPLYLTGHSKGGGMAPIAAYYLYNKQIKANAVYLYAPPLPGNADFANAYNPKFPNTFLYENYQDMVPLIPPSENTAALLDTYLGVAIIEGKISEYWIPFLIMVFGFGLVGYTAVGSAANTFYIRKPVNGVYTIVTMQNYSVVLEQIKAVADVIIADDFSAFEDAHNSRCKYGYMNALSGGICPPSI